MVSNESWPRLKAIIASLSLLGAIAAFPAWAQTSAPLPAAAQDALDKGVIAAKSQDYPLAIRFFSDARKLAPRSPVIYLNLGLAESKIPGRELRAIAWFGAYLAASPNPPNAAAVKEQINALDVRSQSNVSRFIATVQDAAKQLPDRGRQGVDFRPVTELWADVGDFTSAIAISNLIQSEKQKGYAQLYLVKAQIKAGDIRGAQQTVSAIKHPYSNAAALNAVAEAQNKSGDMAGALRSLASALKAAGSIADDPTGKDQILMGAATFQAKSGDIAGSIRTAAPILSSSLKDGALFNIALAQAASGDIIGAQKTAGGIQDMSEKLNVLTFVAEALTKKGDASGAQKVIADLQKSADLLPDKSRLQYSIGGYYIRTGNFVAAEKAFAQISNEGLKSEGQFQLAKAQAEAGDISGARATIEKMRTSSDNSINYKISAQAAIGHAQMRNGDSAGAEKTWASADAAADMLQDDYYKETARADLAKAEGNSVSGWVGMLDDAVEVNECPLNTRPFLDIVSYLQSLPKESDPQFAFVGLETTAKKLVSAQNVVDDILRQSLK